VLQMLKCAPSQGENRFTEGDALLRVEGEREASRPHQSEHVCPLCLLDGAGKVVAVVCVSGSPYVLFRPLSKEVQES